MTMNNCFLRKFCVWGTIGLACSWLLGCKAIPLNQQGLVSKSNMTFSDSPVFAYHSNVLTQLEPGTAGSGGAQAAGCTACQ